MKITSLFKMPWFAKGDNARQAYVRDGHRLYVIGDIHGRADLLGELQRRIDSDLIERPCLEPIEIYLGDVIDRGPDSANVVAQLIQRQWMRQVVVLSGNHERMLLEALDDDRMLQLWLHHGGRDTLVSYGYGENKASLAAMAAHDIRTFVTEMMPKDHLEFLKTLPFFLLAAIIFLSMPGFGPKCLFMRKVKAT